MYEYISFVDIKIQQASRDESSTVDLRKAEEDANKLYQAGKKVC